MTDTTLVALTAGLAVSVWVSRYFVTAHRARRTLAGTRLVTCPETGRPAAVRFDRLHAALTAITDRAPDLQLADCSRWPERGPCDQPCAPEAARPESSVAHIVTAWSDQKRCVLCGAAVTEAPLVGHHIGLRSADGTTIEWPDVPPETVPDALRTHAPVCWNCHIAETFRREYPELAIDR